MKLSFAFKLAWQNIQSNKQVYLPYILSSTLTVGMFFMIASLIVNPVIQESASLLSMFYVGTGIVGIFSFIFIFYANSFVMKRRKKEIGLYNVLGLEKRHIGRVVAVETMISYLVSLAGGLLVGNLFGQLNFWSLNYLLDLSQGFSYTVSISTFATTLLLFGGIFLVTYLYNMWNVQFSNPIALLRGGNEGEKEPKSSLIVFLLGLIALGTGYFISVTIGDPRQAIPLFFLAVLCVIVGTYFLFNAGSIIVLKMLKKRKSFYYKPGPFISISGMIYRMKQHATGLANICILSVMVIIAVATTAVLYINGETTMRQAYPEDNILSILNVENQSEEEIAPIVEEYREDIVRETREANLLVEELVVFRQLAVYGRIENGSFDYVGDVFGSDFNSEAATPAQVTMLSLSDFNQILGEEYTLGENEALIYGDETFEDTLDIYDQTFDIEQIDQAPEVTQTTQNEMFANYVLVFSSTEILENFREQMNAELEQNSETPLFEYMENEIMWSTDGTSETIRQFGEEFTSYLNENGAQENAVELEYGNFEVDRMGYMDLIGSFLFLGIYLGFLFTIGTVLITYFKQISEGFDDREKIQAMQKVGLDKETTRKATRSQVIWMFLLPLITATVHVAFAYPILHSMVNILGRIDHFLLTVTIACVVGVFALIYGVIYQITSKVYLKIVE